MINVRAGIVSGFFSLAVSIASGTASAEPVRVVTSIKPVHSLASMVLEGIAKPHLIVRGANSPHGYAMRPSDASALAHADAVFWIGPAMETFMVKAVQSLPGKARVVALMDDDEKHGEAHDHDHDKAKETAHKHEEHEHEKEKEKAHADEHDHGHGHGHDHGGVDPHVWLDPGHAAEMVEHIAETMTAILPAEAAKIEANRDRALATLHAVEDDIREMVEPYKNEHVVVLHDAYGHFTRHFGLKGFIPLTLTPEHKPSPGKIREVRHEIEEENVRCVFAEPQFPDTHIKLLIEGSGAKAATMDPLGASLEPGPGLYPKLLRNLGSAFKDCLSGKS